MPGIWEGGCKGCAENGGRQEENDQAGTPSDEGEGQKSGSGEGFFPWRRKLSRI
jgi:hypothetical protein